MYSFSHQYHLTGPEVKSQKYFLQWTTYFLYYHLKFTQMKAKRMKEIICFCFGIPSWWHHQWPNLKNSHYKPMRKLQIRLPMTSFGDIRYYHFLAGTITYYLRALFQSKAMNFNEVIICDVIGTFLLLRLIIFAVNACFGCTAICCAAEREMFIQRPIHLHCETCEINAFWSLNRSVHKRPIHLHCKMHLVTFSTQCKCIGRLF